jgi:hydroxymethylbilane synthase
VRQANLRIGTRGSPLALAQAQEVQRLLAAAHGANGPSTTVVTIRTSGDRIQDRPLAEAGGTKGFFTKEIEEALVAGNIDLAVHSLKDVPTFLPGGLALACWLARADARDAFVSHTAPSLAALPPGAVVASSSLRRCAQVLHLRPDLRVRPIRGNVETRLRRLEEGAADATILALAGLQRLGLQAKVTAVLPVEDMLPAVAQGAIAVEIRADDAQVAALLAPLNHAPTAISTTAERAFLARLDGSCRTPIAGLAEPQPGGGVLFRGMLLTPDGAKVVATSRRGRLADALRLAEDAADELLTRAGPEFLRLSTGGERDRP